MLEINNLSFAYGKEMIFQNVSFAAEPGKITSVIGTNGTGKTTLLKCIAGLNKGWSGDIKIGGRARNEMTREEFASRLGYLDQNNYCAAELNVYEVILLGRIRNLAFKVSDEDIRRVDAVTDLLNIRHLLDRNITELSGGQRQMVFIAQTLVKEPDILILDEPTSALDVNHQFQLMNLITRLTRDRGLTTLVTLHHLDLAARYADHIVVLNNGGVHCTGTPQEIMTKEMLRVVYRVDAEIFTDTLGNIHAIPVREITVPVSDR